MSSLVQEEYAKERRTRRMEDFQNSSSIDISENEILKYGDSILNILLFDRTTRRNIIWGLRIMSHWATHIELNFRLQ